MRLLRSASRKHYVVASPRVLGIDPSLTSTGWACRMDGTVHRGTITCGELTGPRRLDYIANRVADLIAKYDPDLIAYEDYAMGKSGSMSRVFDIGELGGVLKRTVWLASIDLMLVSPTALKKAITGKGNPGWSRGKKATLKQKKQPMVDALLQDFGVEVYQYDEADAIGLMLLGEIRCGVNTLPENAVTSARLDAAKQFTVVRGKMKSFAK